VKNPKDLKSKILEYVILIIVFALITYVIFSLNSEPEFEDLGQPPSIELIGEKRFIQPLGEEFKDPGIIAIDAHGNDISDRVNVRGEINLEEEDVNFLYYSVTDMHGNKSREIVRLVSVQEECEDGDSTIVIDDALLEEIIKQEIEKHKEEIKKIQKIQDIKTFYQYEDCNIVEFLSPHVENNFSVANRPERKLLRSTIRDILVKYDF
jgi:hypothetical protein